MRLSFKAAAGVAVAAGLVAVPATAASASTGLAVGHPALTLAPRAIASAAPFQSCYAVPANGTGLGLPISLTGGNPGDSYEIDAYQGTQAIGSTSDDPTFDVNGDGSDTTLSIDPDLKSIGPIAGVPVTLDVVDTPADGGPQTTTPLGGFDVTTLALNVSDTPVDPLKPRLVQLSGVFPDSKDYGFVTNTKGTKVLKYFSLGESNACGYVSRKVVVMPKRFALGEYRLYINPGTKLNKKKALLTKFKIYQR